MTTSKDTVVVAMSGGVDSSVAAALLQEQGRSVVGVFMRNGVKADPARGHRQGCCGLDDALDARRVADRLGIPFYALDFEESFSELVSRFVTAYAEGRTPNPCIECNRLFKFGALQVFAERIGAKSVASGHYARKMETESGSALRRAVDLDKDQSYVLFSLSSEVLSRCEFPLGDLTKAQVRELARARNLPVAEKAESMEICFVPTGNYRDLVRQHRSDVLRPGPIRHVDGRILGEHGGTALFTIGQRRGLPGGQSSPLHVVALDSESNTVVVGGREQLESTRFNVDDVTLTGAKSARPGAVLSGCVQIRAHHEAVAMRALVLEDGSLEVSLLRPEASVTPGQAAVLYDGDLVLAGGWIRSVVTPSLSVSPGISV